MEGGRILIVEYKNSKDWDLPDNEEKRRHGRSLGSAEPGEGVIHHAGRCGRRSEKKMRTTVRALNKSSSVLDLADYETKVRSAVKLFWASRKGSSAFGKFDDNVDIRELSNLGSGSMSGFVDLIHDIVFANGLKDADIKLKRRLYSSPSNYCLDKFWDVIVLNKGRLIAAINLNSLFGPSYDEHYGENVATARDLWTAYREGGFGESKKPFVGYLMLLEDAPASRRPVMDFSLNFPVFPEFQNASYAERYNILCRKLMGEQFYTSATVILSPRTASKNGEYSEMSEMTGLKAFITTLAGHVAAEAAM